MNFNGQVGIITGGGRGLGKAFAEALAAAGMHVVVVSRTAAELEKVVGEIKQAGGSASYLTADVTDAKRVKDLIATVEQEAGPIDLLINNAGGLSAIGAISDIDEAEWWREMEINVRGPMLFSNAVLPKMIDRGRGRIINMASAAGLGVMAKVSAYCVSKAAVIRLTENMAVEVAEHGIKVFSIHPGTVRTPLFEYLHSSETVAERAPELQSVFQQLSANEEDTPVERPIQLILKLASGAGDGLSGCYFDVDDDVAALQAKSVEILQADKRKLRLEM